MFDLRVHKRDKTSGKVISKNPYQLVCEGGRLAYVRNGVRFHANGTKFNPADVEIIPKTEEDLKIDLAAELAKAKKLTEMLETKLAFDAKAKAEEEAKKELPAQTMVSKAKAAAAAEKAKPELDI